MKNKVAIIIAGVFAGIILVFMILISLLKFGVIGDYGNDDKPNSPQPEIPVNNNTSLSCSYETTSEGIRRFESYNLSFVDDRLTNYSKNVNLTGDETANSSNFETIKQDETSKYNAYITNGVTVSINPGENNELSIYMNVDYNTLTPGTTIEFSNNDTLDTVRNNLTSQGYMCN